MNPISMQRAETTDTSPPTRPQIEHIASCALPTPWANFQLHAFLEQSTGKEHLAMVLTWATVNLYWLDCTPNA